MGEGRVVSLEGGGRSQFSGSIFWLVKLLVGMPTGDVGEGGDGVCVVEE